MPSRFDFSGKVVVVTGGTRGIGAALVDIFHSAGARLVVTGTSQAGLLELEAAHAAKGIHDIRYLQADFLDPVSFAGFLDTLAGLPMVDVCVNNAGINRNNMVEDITAADVDRIIQVNLKAPMLICQALARVMERSVSGGRIVNISSIWGLIAKRGRGAYGAAKAGIAGFTRHIAVDLAPHSILVNSVSPGFTRTDLTESMLTATEIEELAAQVPLHRIADPAEIARVVLFLASDLNTFITGQNIVVDGGFSIV
jgi:3-oxoacyl-[acyl-carrier protein] reductase